MKEERREERRQRKKRSERKEEVHKPSFVLFCLAKLEA